VKVASLPAKFHDKIVDTGTCWTWVASATLNGYGQVSVRINGERRVRYAHRAVYELLVGPIPEGMVIDHLCRNKLCVNPAHLEVVTNRENLMRGNGPGPVAARTNACLRGHIGNWHVRKNGGRLCKTCQQMKRRQYYEKHGA